MRRNRCLAIVGWILFFALAARPQTIDRAELVGQVTDESGAVMSNVALVLRNDATGLQFRSVSSPTGGFFFSSLPIGAYTLTAERDGFHRLKIANVLLSTNQRRDLPVVMKVGNVDSEITVTTELNKIETSTPAIKTIFSEKQIADLPVVIDTIGRSVQSTLLSLTTGASNYDFGSSGNTSTISVNGSPVGGVGFSFDGIDNTALFTPGVGALTDGPPPDAIGQFSVLTHTFTAENGGHAALAQLETKSGSNRFHAQLRGIHLDPTASARDFFDRERKSSWLTNAFGFQFAGPLSIADKTVFFFDTELNRSRESFTDRATVLTDEERQGDFSSLPQNRWPVDPITKQVFPNGHIPTNRILPQSRRFIDEVIRKPTDGRMVTDPHVERRGARQITGRIDHQISLQDLITMSGFESKNWADDPIPDTQVSTFRWRSWGNNAALRYTHNFSNSRVNSLAFGRSYNRSIQYTDGVIGDIRQNGFNITTSAAQAFPNAWLQSTSNFISGGRILYASTTNWTVKDDLAFPLGRHSIKVGAQMRYIRASELQRGFLNDFTFSAANQNGTGNDVADFLLGLPVAYTETSDRSVFPNRLLSAFYFQDDVRVNSNLAVNAGLRYEINGGWTDRERRRTIFRPGAQSRAYPKAPVGILFPGDIDPATGKPISASINPTDYNNVGPRIGAAWARTDTSLRLGYGIYHITSPANAVHDMLFAPPWSVVTQRDLSQLIASGGNFANPWGSDPDPLSAPISAREFALPLCCFATVDNNAREPYEQQWTLSIARQLPYQVSVEVAYLGNSTVHQYRRYQGNPAIVTADATVNNVEQRRQYRNIGTVYGFTSDGRSDFHALQLNANRRFASHFEFNTNYVWSKALDNVGNNISDIFAFGDRALTPWARANYDRRQQFTFSAVWETPAFHFRSIERILSGWQITPVLSVRSGMPMDIRNPYDSTLAGNDDQPQGAIGGTAEMIGPFRKLDPRRENTFRLPNGSISTAHFLFDPTSFKILSPAGPEQARMGNLGRNVFTGPGVNNLDLSVLRRIALGESQKLELRVDSTNVLNHAQFLASRAGTFNTRNGVFGVTDRTTGSRRFQFVIKLAF